MKTTMHTNIGNIIYDPDAAKSEKESIDALRTKAEIPQKITRGMLIGLFFISVVALIAYSMQALSLLYGILVWTFTVLSAIVHFVVWASTPYYNYSNNVLFWMLTQNGTLQNFSITPPRKMCRWTEPAKLICTQTIDDASSQQCSISLGYSSILCNDIAEHVVDLTENENGIWYEAACVRKNAIDQQSMSYHRLATE